MQMPARTPACAAMTAMTLQALSGDRFLLGIGPSGPQVIEGWHGSRLRQAAGAHARIRRDRAPGVRARGAARRTTASTTRSPTPARARPVSASR